jgi:hypothetical protein
MHVAQRKRNQAEATPPLLYANASVSVPVTLEEAKRWKDFSFLRQYLK